MASQLSPNALLRPIMQDYLLPTASYVAGPSETAYFAQGAALYEKLLGRMPVIYPRNSFTLLDARADKLLTRFGLRVPDLLDHHENVKGVLAAKLVPPAISEQIKAAQTAASQALTQMQGGLMHFDPTLEAARARARPRLPISSQNWSERSRAKRCGEMSERQKARSTWSILCTRKGICRNASIRFCRSWRKHGLDLPQRLLRKSS